MFRHLLFKGEQALAPGIKNSLALLTSGHDTASTRPRVAGIQHPTIELATNAGARGVNRTALIAEIDAAPIRLALKREAALTCQRVEGFCRFIT